MTNREIVRQDFEEYIPKFNENTGEYYDVCPYEKFSRCQKITYKCPCISGRSLNTRQQFLQHFNTKTHITWRNNLGKDDNKKVIKDLQIENGKKDLLLQQKNNKIDSFQKMIDKLNKDINYKQNTLKLQSREIKKLINKQKNLRKEISFYVNNLKIKNDLIIELEENVKLLEEASNLSIEYESKESENYESDSTNFTVSESINTTDNVELSETCSEDDETSSETCSETCSESSI